MRLCTYAVKQRGGFVMVESPGKADEDGWELVKYEPISEGTLCTAESLRSSFNIADLALYV